MGLDSGCRETAEGRGEDSFGNRRDSCVQCLFSDCSEHSPLVDSPWFSFRDHMPKRQVFIWTVGRFQRPSSSLLMSVALRTELCKHLPCMLSPFPAPPGPCVFQNRSGKGKFRKRKHSLSFRGLLCIPDDTPTVLWWKTALSAICTGERKKKNNPTWVVCHF